ncbi:hypothetical protein Tco_1380239 [Tanacetum coccineum]
MISSTNMRIDPTLTQKEETYQVILDIIKTSPCYNAFLITADVPEICMQQFWYIVKKVKKSSFYQFDLADKKCQVDVELFRKILRNCPRVPKEEFVEPPSEESILTFLIELGYKVVSKGEDYQVYGLTIPNTMLTDEIKQSEHYQTFLSLSTGLISPKKSRGKGSKGKNSTITPKKKGSITADDNIIPELDVTLRLGSLSAELKLKLLKKQEEITRSDSEAKSHKLEAQVKELVLHLRFLMSQQAYSQPQVKELVLYQSDEEEKIHDDDDDDMSIDIDETDDDERTESDNEEYVADDADKEMNDGENAKTGKDDEEMTDAKMQMLKRQKKRRVIMSKLKMNWLKLIKPKSLMLKIIKQQLLPL